MPLHYRDRSSVDNELTINGSESSTRDLLEEENNVRLPTYLTQGDLARSPFSPTVVLDCVGFLQTSLKRTRLAIFEINRRQSSIFSRSRLDLKDSALDLDKLLAETENSLVKVARFDDVMGGYWLIQALVAHPDFKKANASAKTKLLRFDRDLRVVVMEPLKRALIEKKKPDYDKLKETARSYPTAVVDICRRWDAEVFTVARCIEEHGPPNEAIIKMLGMERDEMNILIKQATQNNLDVLHHVKFVALGGRQDKSSPSSRSDVEIKAIQDFLEEYCISLNLPALEPDPKKDGDDDT